MWCIVICIINRSYRITKEAVWEIVNGITGCDQKLTWDYIVNSKQILFPLGILHKPACVVMLRKDKM